MLHFISKLTDPWIMTTEERINALLRWLEQVRPPDVDVGAIVALARCFQDRGELTAGQHEQLEIIIKENNLVLEHYLN